MDTRTKALYLKVAFVALNVLLALIGVRYIGFSLYEWLESPPEYVDPFKLYTQVIIGALLLCNSFLGCIAVGRSTFGLMWTYIICLLMLLGLQLYLHIVVGKPFTWIWSDFVYSNTLAGSLEQQHKCCGKFGVQDYLLVDSVIPLSCYEDHRADSNRLYRLGCLAAIDAHAGVYYGIVGLLVKCALFIFQLLPLCMALSSVLTIRRQLRQEVSMTSALKVTFIVSNSLVMLIGVAFIVAAIYEWQTTPRIVGDVTIYVQLIVGIFLILNFALCCVAVQYLSLLLMWSYVACLLVLLGLQVYVLIVDPFRWLWSNLAHSSRIIASIEQQFDCCGLLGRQDYYERNMLTPARCRRGCLEAMGSYVRFSGTGDFIIKRRVFFMQLFPLCLAMYLALKRPKKQFKPPVINTLTLLQQHT